MLAVLRDGEETRGEILNKPAHLVTEPEMDKVIAGDGFLYSGHPEAKRTGALMTNWYQHVYGAGEAAAQARIAAKPTPTRLAGGGTVTDAALRIGRDVLKAAPETEAEPAISRLQESLNAMAGDRIPLKLDGDFGPKYNEVLRRLVLRDGTRGVWDRLFPA